MRVWWVLLYVCSPWLVLPAQTDSLLIPAKKEKIPVHFQLFDVSLSYLDGNIQFFNGYSQEIMYTNSRSGLPLYNDWHVFSKFTILPDFYSFRGHISLADTLKKFRLRLGVVWFSKTDSMSYTAGFSVNDTIYGRSGTEKSQYAGVFISSVKTTRKLAKFFRLYGGAELEATFASTSKIHFMEYATDFGERTVIEENHFDIDGNSRLNFFGTALVGAEFIFLKKIGVSLEGRSGVGVHWIPGIESYGISRNAFQVGAHYYFLPN